MDDNHCLVEASEWIEVGLLRTLPCFFVESLASYHGWDCILQGVCVHVMRVEGVHDGHGSVIFRYFFSRIQYLPHSYGVISSASNLYLGSLLARLKNPSDRQFLAMQLFDQPGIPHVPTIVASALWLIFSDPRPHSEN